MGRVIPYFSVRGRKSLLSVGLLCAHSAFIFFDIFLVNQEYKIKFIFAHQIPLVKCLIRSINIMPVLVWYKSKCDVGHIYFLLEPIFLYQIASLMCTHHCWAGCLSTHKYPYLFTFTLLKRQSLTDYVRA